MDVNKIGKAIACLRKRAGYTQKDLADRIGISDKAVSKWERGIGLPEIGYLRRLSILLDTDSDSLLAGDVVHHDGNWQGVIVTEENPYGIGIHTMVYDKPIVYFLLSYFLLVGIRNILIVCNEREKRYMDETMGDGSEYGIRLFSFTGKLCDAVKKWDGEAMNTMLVYGRCLLYGVDQTRFFQKAMIDKERFTVLALPKRNCRSSHIQMDVNKKIVSSNEDEPLRTQYDYSDIPILLFPSRLLHDVAKEEDIPTFIYKYTSENEMYVAMLDRGFVEIEVDSFDHVQEASAFLKIVQDKCGMNVYCLEEVAWRRGLITTKQLRMHGNRYGTTEYGAYILSLCDRVSGRER